MTLAYELALLGEPTTDQAKQVEEAVADMVALFNLRLGHEVSWSVRPRKFAPNQKRAAAAAFFGGVGVSAGATASLINEAIPLIPIVSDIRNTSSELPSQFRMMNALAYADVGPKRVASALLECAGLLPHQRRVFVSYRREEAKAAALQLFDALSARHYDVFLDTRGVPPGEAFQSVLWHRLCESDVLIMLDTAGYFASRWTSAEFGRALAKGISVLRIGWPGVSRSARTATASGIELLDSEVGATDGLIAPEAIERICVQLEVVRSESVAVRRLNLVSKLGYGVRSIGGTVAGVGIGSGAYLRLPDGKLVVAYPSVGVPTAETLHEARLFSPDADVAVIYDHIGISEKWLQHLNWLGDNITMPRWVKVTEASWDLADGPVPNPVCRSRADRDGDTRMCRGVGRASGNYSDGMGDLPGPWRELREVNRPIPERILRGNLSRRKQTFR
jgi:hypothetical protein